MITLSHPEPMKPKHLFRLFLTCMVFASCQNNHDVSKSLPVFDLWGNKDHLIEKKMSDLVSGISYVPLEFSSEAILDIAKCLVPAGDYFIIATWKDQLSVFDRKGKFINNIGKIGKGPGEYQSIRKVFWDQKNREVIVHNIVGAVLLFYTLDGKYLRSFKAPYLVPEIYRMQDGIYLGVTFLPVLMDSIYSRHFFFDERGMVRPVKPTSPVPFVDAVQLQEQGSHCVMGSKDLYLTARCDTVFMYDHLDLKPYCIINTGGYRAPDELYYDFDNSRLNERRQYIIGIGIISASNDSFTLWFGYQDERYHFICNTTDGTTRLVQRGSSSILNDLDGGHPYFFTSGYFNNTFYSVFDAFYMLTSFREGQCNNPNQQFIDMIHDLNENSNPVIVMYHLK